MNKTKNHSKNRLIKPFREALFSSKNHLLEYSKGLDRLITFTTFSSTTILFQGNGELFFTTRTKKNSQVN